MKRIKSAGITALISCIASPFLVKLMGSGEEDVNQVLEERLLHTSQWIEDEIIQKEISGGRYLRTIRLGTMVQ